MLFVCWILENDDEKTNQWIIIWGYSIGAMCLLMSVNPGHGDKARKCGLSDKRMMMYYRVDLTLISQKSSTSNSFEASRCFR